MIHILCIAVQNAAWRTNLVQMYVTFRVLCSFATVTQCYQHWVTIPETSPSFHKANHEDVESIRCEEKITVARLKWLNTLLHCMTRWRIEHAGTGCARRSHCCLLRRGVIACLRWLEFGLVRAHFRPASTSAHSAFSWDLCVTCGRKHGRSFRRVLSVTTTLGAYMPSIRVDTDESTDKLNLRRKGGIFC